MTAGPDPAQGGLPIAASREAGSRAGTAVALLRDIKLTRPTLTLLVSVWLVTFCNFPFWHTTWRDAGGARADNLFFLLSMPLFVLAWVYLLLSLLAWGRATKAVLGAALLCSAAVSYFSYTYGMLLDHTMIANVVQTHLAEVRSLVSWRLSAWLLAFGVAPALLVARAPVTATSWKRDLVLKALGITAAVACLTAILLFNYQHYAPLLRNHRELRFMLVPHNMVAAMHGHLKQYFAAPALLQVVGADAARAAAVSGTKPMLTIVVVGETARAANFSLNGYARQTNPELASRHVLSFPDVSACGTSTAVSVPCMFLDVGRNGFDGSLALRREGLLDVLQHAGIKVLWRDNNSGCKGVCDRVPHEDLSNLGIPGLCDGGECYDEVLLHGLQNRIDRLKGDAVFVLHMHGSHGPAYFKRYPQAFEHFNPVCATVQLDQCERQAIVNAYDNSLRYTDHVLSRTIDILRNNAERFDTAMLYVSDHGESLGENGLYLHGIPYALAPSEQIKVPMLLWLSEGWEKRTDMDMACLEARQREPLSHDNLYHSVLGLMRVRTAVYRAERDLFRPCQS